MNNRYLDNNIESLNLNANIIKVLKDNAILKIEVF